MEQILHLQTLDNEQDMRQRVQIALQYIGHGEQFEKNKAFQYLMAIVNNLDSKNSPPISKFYSVMMLKQLTEKGQTKLFSVLSGHNLLKYMSRMALQIDPNKPITEKGKNYFKQDKKIGNDYIRLILECLKVWGEKYQKSKNDQPTKYRKTLNQLNQANVVMPTQLKFFNVLAIKKKESDKKVSQTITPIGGSQNMGKVEKKSSYDKDFDYSHQKIGNFIQILNNGEDYQQQVHIYHKMFTKQTQKYERIQDQILTSGDQNAAQKFIGLLSFYNAQKQAYKQKVVNKNDYKNYANLIKDEYAKIGGRVSQKKNQASKNSIPGGSNRQNRMNENPTQQNKVLISNLMSKLQSRSKSPIGGFKDLKESLSKEKSMLRSTKRSVSPMNRSGVTRFGQSNALSKSRIPQIFSNPPNPNLRPKRYEGDVIKKNRNLANILQELSKSQGIRRFVTSNFKTKSPLFQNNHIQIGFKTEPIYQEVSEFKIMINMELYFGNKTQETIKNISIQYKGNSDVLLYGNPRIVQPTLQPGYQNKHQLMVVPLKQQYPLIKLKLRYMINNQTINERITLPNSIIKLASYRGLDKSQFTRSWSNSQVIRTQEFRLSKYISPDSISKYIPNLEQMSSYQRFLEKGSQTDFELGCLVVLKHQHQAILKINVRPNLNVVIQIGIIDQNSQSQKSFIYYMQTLQMLLTHAEHTGRQQL